jgi:hypothetical protein
MSAPIEYVSVREFSRLDGCDDKLVRRAIKGGKLPVSADGKVNSALAGSGWRRRNRRAAEGADNPEMSAPNVRTRKIAPALIEVPPEAADMEPEDFIAAVLAGRFKLLGEAERVKENALAAKNLLAARREAGDVVDIETAEAVLFEAARSTRDAWMNFPGRIGPLLAAELGLEPDRVVEALTAHVQQQLQDLGEPDADFSTEQ